VAAATVAAIRLTTDPSHVAAALKARATLNGKCGASPPIKPISFLPSPTSPNRLYVVTVDRPLPTAVTPCALIAVDSWANANARINGAHFFGAIDGVRWKSSGGEIYGPNGYTFWTSVPNQPP
jgi:hypothetical protein